MIVRMFKPQFAELVESGRKLQTVRPTPKRMPEPGDRISLRCWTGKPYRSPQRVLREATVTRVGRIEITADGFEHWEDEGHGVRRNADSLNAFARLDGFDDWSSLVAWFLETHGLPFEGILIRWEMLPDGRWRWRDANGKFRCSTARELVDDVRGRDLSEGARGFVDAQNDVFLWHAIKASMMVEPVNGGDDEPASEDSAPMTGPVTRLDCPSGWREHFWSIPNNGMIECLWCFERRSQ